MSAQYPAVLQLEGIGKEFRIGFRQRRVRALDDVTLSVSAGEILGVLGPNGAGKTTLFKTALGLLKPSAGTGHLLGKPLGDRAARQRVGFLPEEPYFYPHLTAHETLDLMAGLSRLPRAEVRGRITRVSALCQLEAYLDSPVRKLSRGWLRRLGLAAALLPDPQLLFLDEPLSGLDPEARLLVKELIVGLRARGKTVLVSSHILPDVEALADRIALLREGRLIACGSLSGLLGGTARGYEVELRGSTILPLPANAQKLWEHSERGVTRWWLPDAEAEEIPALLADWARRGVSVVAVAPHCQTLEALFVELVKSDAESASALPRGRTTAADRVAS